MKIEHEKCMKRIETFLELQFNENDQDIDIINKHIQQTKASRKSRKKD